MKKLLLAALWLPLMALAQTYPSPTYQNVTVLGTLTGKVNSTGSTITNATITGGTISGLSSPLPVASGGTNSASASGTALDNISGFAGTGFMSRTGAGAYSFTASTGSGNVVQATAPTIASPTITGALTATGLVTTADLATQAANTTIGNGTGSTASPTALAMPSCSGSTNALGWTSGTGFNCNGAINAATLGGATFAAPGPIGSATASTGAFTTLNSSSGLTVSGGGAAITGASSFATSVTVPTQALGNNSTNAATTAFVSNRGPCANIMDFGGNNAGGGSNDTAFTNAIAAASNTANNKCVFFPPGTFVFTNQAGFTFTAAAQAVSVIGSGQDVTNLYWANNGGLGFSYTTCDDTVHVQDLTLMAGNTNLGSGITLINPTATTLQSCGLSTIERVTIKSSTGYFGTNYFQYGIITQGVSNVNFDSIQAIGPSGGASGTGIYIGPNSHNNVTIDFTMSNTEVNDFNVAVQVNNLVQGVLVTNSSFTGNNYGLYVPAGGTGLNLIGVSNSQFNSNASGFNVYMLSAVPDITMTGNLFLINNNSSGINLAASSYTTIIGNSFQPNTGSPTNVYGVIIGGWVAGNTMISGNMYYNLTIGNDLLSTSKNINVQSNSYNACVTNNSNSGTGNVVGGGSP